MNNPFSRNREAAILLLTMTVAIYASQCVMHAAPTKLPDGAPKSNYLRTVPGKGWFTLFRLYSPTKGFFDQSWRPGDFEKISK